MSDVTVVDSNNVNGRRQKLHEYQQASLFYAEKLENYPTMSRYTHFMASLANEHPLVVEGRTEKGYENLSKREREERTKKIAEADFYYRQTLLNAPHDVSVKNDFALHLLNNYSGYEKKASKKQQQQQQNGSATITANDNRKEDALKELRKALVLNNENPLLYNNLAAITAKNGDYRKALEYAQRALFLAPHDTRIIRNIARLEAALGDNYSSLKHNQLSVELDTQRAIDIANTIGEGRASDFVPNTAAYRKAAVQMISQSGNTSEALELMNQARKYEKKEFQLSTSQRTYEIINKLKKRQGDQFKVIEKQKQEEEERKQQSKAEWEKLLTDMTR